MRDFSLYIKCNIYTSSFVHWFVFFAILNLNNSTKFNSIGESQYFRRFVSNDIAEYEVTTVKYNFSLSFNNSFFLWVVYFYTCNRNRRKARRKKRKNICISHSCFDILKRKVQIIIILYIRIVLVCFSIESKYIVNCFKRFRNIVTRILKIVDINIEKIIEEILLRFRRNLQPFHSPRNLQFFEMIFSDFFCQKIRRVLRQKRRSIFSHQKGKVSDRN